MEEPRQTGKGKASTFITSQMPRVQTVSDRDFERSLPHMLKEM